MKLNREVTAAEVAQQLEQSIGAADTKRAEELDRLKIIREAQTGGMEREAARLTDKLGSDHPRVMALTTAIEINRGFVRDLAIEADRARTDIPTVDAKSWVLHGYTRDQNLKGVAGLTVAVYDEKGAWVERLGFACTNENGYFRLTTSDVAGLDSSVFAQVLKNGTLVHGDKAELKPELGRVDYREMTLSEEVKVCTPPIVSSAPPTKPPDTPPRKPPDVPPTKPPDGPPSGDPEATPDAWVVRGRVTDKSGEGLDGLTVSVFDKDLTFEDRLGETKTDAGGNFSIVYHAEDFRDVVERKPDIYVKVLDQKGKTIYTSKESVRFEAGRMEVFEIKIAAGKVK